MRLANKKLEDIKAKLEEENDRLLREIWEAEDSLSLAKKTLSTKDAIIQELTSKLETVEKENATLKKQIEEQSKTPGAWSLPHQ